MSAIFIILVETCSSTIYFVTIKNIGNRRYIWYNRKNFKLQLATSKIIDAKVIERWMKNVIPKSWKYLRQQEKKLEISNSCLIIWRIIAWQYCTNIIYSYYTVRLQIWKSKSLNLPEDQIHTVSYWNLWVGANINNKN